MKTERQKTRIIVYLLVLVGFMGLAFILIPPFFKEGGLFGNGVSLLVTILSFWFAFMACKG